MLQDTSEIEDIAEGKVPFACLPIGQLPLVAYQISFLESNGIFDIYVAVKKTDLKKTEKMLKALCNTPK